MKEANAPGLLINGSVVHPQGVGRKTRIRFLSFAIYCGYWSVCTLRDAERSDVSLYLFQCVCVCVCVCVCSLSKYGTLSQQLLPQHFHLRSIIRMTLWYMHKSVCVCICVCVCVCRDQNRPEETQNPWCVTQSSSQPGAQVSNRLLKTDGSPVVFLSIGGWVRVCVLSLSK